MAAGNMLAQSLTLPGGRQLSYAEFGPAQGTPVLYFTGGNSSRLEGQWFEQAAARKKVRLIVPDRPGFGLSTFQPNRRLLDWPRDVEALADHLSLTSVSIFGLSGGGPHVLAALAAIPDRIRRAAVVSGTAPPQMPGLHAGMWPPVRILFLSARRFPWLNRLLLKQMAGFYDDEVQMRKRMIQALPEPDVELIERRPEVITIFAAAAREAHRQGLDGDNLEWQIYITSWGFEPAEIKRDVRLWYGLADRHVPIGMGRFLAAQLPGATLIEVADGGHFSTVNNCIDDILDYLVEAS
jgi:pimeloyl-ACP methyl ester carboxylesterase